MSQSLIEIHGNIPAAADAERSILGAILLEPGLAFDVAWALRPDYFFLDNNRRVFSAIVELFENGIPIDVMTVCDRLSQHKQLEAIGGVTFVSSLTDGVPRRATIKHFTDLVKEKYALRTLLTGIQQAATRIASGDVNAKDAATALEDALLDVSTTGKQFRSMADVMRDTADEIARLRELPDDVILGATLDFHPLDEITTGIRDDELWVIGARPNVGKTPFGMQIALANARRRRKKVAVFSLEMASLQLGMRCLIHQGYADPWRLRDPRRMDGDEWRRAYEGAANIAELPMLIDDCGSQSVREIRNKIRYAVRRLGVELIVIDYLQLINGGGKNQYESTSNAARALRELVRETKVPIVALSQLNRNAKDPSKEPDLADLRESGVIEQEANVVVLIHRPRVSESGDENADDWVMSPAGKFILAKVREGTIGPEPFIFDETTLTFRPGL